MYTAMKMKFLNAIEVYEYYKAEYGAPGRKREKRKKPTKEQVDKINQANRERLCRWRLRQYFQTNDYFIRLSYKVELRPEDMAKAKKDFSEFARKLRKEYKKRGYELRFIRNIEVGSRGAWHTHIVINRIPDGDVLVRKCWPHGSIWFQLLYEKGNFKDLAAYLTKTPKTDKRLKEASYSTSRNMPLPEPERKDYERWKPWAKVKIPKGWSLEEEPVEGQNPITGHTYRRYTLIRNEQREREPAKIPKRKRKQKAWTDPPWWDGQDIGENESEEV